MKLTCQQCRAALLGYVEGSLEARLRAAVEDHLATCPDCRAELDQWRAIWSATVAAHGMLRPPVGAQQRGWERLVAQLATPGFTPMKGISMTFESSVMTGDLPAASSKKSRRGFVPVAAVMVAVIVLIAFIAWRWQSSPQISRPYTRPIIVVSQLSDLRGGSASNQTITALDPLTGRQEWQHQLGVVFDFVQVAGDRVIAITADDHNTRMIVALRMSDGADEWRIPLGGSEEDMLATPTVTYFAVQLTAANGDPTGTRIIALDTSTGRQQWQRMLPAFTSFGSSLTTSFNLTADTLILTGMQTTTQTSAMPPTMFIGLNRADGQLRWQRSFPSPPGYTIDANVLQGAVVSGQSFVIALATSVVALNAVTGNENWQFAHSGQISTDGTMLFINDVATCSQCSEAPQRTNRLYAVRPADGMISWQHAWTLQNGATNAGIYLGDHLVFGEDANAQQLMAFDALTGKVLWQKPLVVISFAASAGHVYLLYAAQNTQATATETLAAIDENSGAVLWQKSSQSTGLSPLFSLEIQGGALVGISGANQLAITAFQPSDGAILWHAALPGEIIRILNEPF